MYFLWMTHYLSTRPRKDPTLKVWPEHTELFNFSCLPFLFSNIWISKSRLYTFRVFLTCFPFYSILISIYMYNIFCFYKDAIYIFSWSVFFCSRLCAVSSEFHCSFYSVRSLTFMLEAFCNCLVVLGWPLIFKREAVASCAPDVKDVPFVPLCHTLRLPSQLHT